MADDLNMIGLRHGTDKASNANDYLAFYARFLEPMRAHAVKVLEIGVLDGASLRTWRDYFPNGSVVGVDVDQAARIHAGDRISIEIADQSRDADLHRLAALGPFDLILDDGSHFWRHQIRTFQLLAPAVRPGGFYVIEDLDTSYGRHAAVYGGGRSTADYLRELSDWIVGYRQMASDRGLDRHMREIWPIIDYLVFWRGTALMQRRLTPRPNDTGAPPWNITETGIHLARRSLRTLRWYLNGQEG